MRDVPGGIVPGTTWDHSKQDQILLVKIVKYIGFRVYRRSYLLWSPAIVVLASLLERVGVRFHPRRPHDKSWGLSPYEHCRRFFSAQLSLGSRGATAHDGVPQQARSSFLSLPLPLRVVSRYVFCTSFFRSVLQAFYLPLVISSHLFSSASRSLEHPGGPLHTRRPRRWGSFSPRYESRRTFTPALLGHVAPSRRIVQDGGRVSAIALSFSLSL